MMKDRRIITFCLLLVGTLTSIAVADDREPEWIAKAIAEIMAQAGEIVFYGKVLDQHGHPVAGATVMSDAPIPIGYMREERRQRTLQTDTNGCFEISKETYGFKELKGGHLTLRISKEGYDSGQDWLRQFVYQKDSPLRFVPDGNRPVLFHLRQKGELAFLIKGEPRAVLEQNAEEVGTDIFLLSSDYRQLLHDNPKVDRGLFPHVVAQADLNETDDTWTVTFIVSGEGAGILMTTNMLYEAPAFNQAERGQP